tara:strand:- start:177 stop:497 length:321 start_codon:yes stop_codon:yes gene_type:complete
MIPFIRSLNELMVLTKSKDEYYRESKKYELNNLKGESCQRKRCNRANEQRKIKLPDLPMRNRRKWIRSKEAISKFFNDIDYNYQIQSSYELTLLERQNNHDNQDIA